MADEQRISPEVGGYVKAFATTDMVNTFTLGFSPDVFRSVRSTLRKELGVFAGKVLDGIERPEVAPDLKALVEETIQEHTSHWTTEVLDRHAQPLRNVVSALPIDEMANLAETLISLESLKEKVTKPSESVSGPIDVAVITRGEGFIWVKRKHYFAPELNPRFFQRRQSDIAQSDGLEHPDEQASDKLSGHPRKAERPRRPKASDSRPG